MVKFGNTKPSGNSGRHMLGESYNQLNTIEEEKNETQTSNYFDGISEREDSKMLGSKGSNQLRGSNVFNGVDLEDNVLRKSEQQSPNANK